MQKIIIGSDHAGFQLKKYIIENFKNALFEDAGTYSEESVDYPDYAKKVCESIQSNKFQKGVLICGSGVGISISANKFHNIRAGLCHVPEIAKLSRQHNDANILCLGARFTDSSTAIECLNEFLRTEFEGGRHLRRVEKIEYK